MEMKITMADKTVKTFDGLLKLSLPNGDQDEVVITTTTMKKNGQKRITISLMDIDKIEIIIKKMDKAKIITDDIEKIEIVENKTSEDIENIAMNIAIGKATDKLIETLGDSHD